MNEHNCSKNDENDVNTEKDSNNEKYTNDNDNTWKCNATVWTLRNWRTLRKNENDDNYENEKNR